MTKTFIDRYNAVAGSVVMILTLIFGTYWYVFAGYLLCNILDWLTGWYKSRKLGKESSKAGLKGAAKKVGYWIIIAVAFLIPALFIHLGKDLLGIDLGFLVLLGWFTSVHGSELSLKLCSLDSILVCELFLHVDCVFFLHDVIKALVSHDNSVENCVLVVFKVILL